jgi:hypothetical protein
MRSDFLGYVCSCCALATANDDTSGCEAYCGDEHVERVAVLRHTLNVLIRCVGCGDDTMTDAWEAHVLY